MLSGISKNVGLLSVFIVGLTGGLFADIDTPQRPVEPQALDVAGIRQLQQADPNLTGSGVVIAAVCRSNSYFNGRPQNDYRFDMNHRSLAGADIWFEDHSDGLYGVSPHSTAIAGILIGLDPDAALPDGAPFAYRGVSPLASVDVYEFWRFAGLRIFTDEPVSADIITLSLGDVFEDWWTRGIERLAAEQGTVVVAAIGNGQAARDPILYPAAGANVIGVGVLESALTSQGRPSRSDFTVPTARHSSQGPTDDLRSKPDLVAPGTAIVPDAGSADGYTVVANASSLAAPMVAGTAALLLQHAYDNELFGDILPEAPVNCIIKAVLMNAAQKLPYWHKGGIDPDDDTEMPLDRLQGAGALDARGAMTQLDAGRQRPGSVEPLGWDSGIITEDDTYYYVFESSDPNAMLTATLTWNRHYQDSYPFHRQPQQSDLRLELWAIDPDAPDGMVLLDVSDSPVDTVEHLWTPLLEAYTHYAVAVRFSPASAFASPPEQHFALAWSVGPDSSLGHPLWQDLNGDGKIDHLDRFIHLLLESGHLQTMEPAFYTDILNLSQERFELLTGLWHRWQPYLNAESQPTID